MGQSGPRTQHSVYDREITSRNEERGRDKRTRAVERGGRLAIHGAVLASTNGLFRGRYVILSISSPRRFVSARTPATRLSLSRRSRDPGRKKGTRSSAMLARKETPNEERREEEEKNDVDEEEKVILLIRVFRRCALFHRRINLAFNPRVYQRSAYLQVEALARFADGVSQMSLTPG